MKKILFLIFYLTILHINAQTWIEKSLNGLSYGNNPPPINTISSLYAEPFDTIWRQGLTGIGTFNWPKVKLHVHTGTDINTIVDEIVNLHGSYNNHNMIVSNGGNVNSSFLNSFLSVTQKNNMSIGIASVMGIGIGNKTPNVIGVYAVSEGDTVENSFGLKAQGGGFGNKRNIGVHAEGAGVFAHYGNFGVWGQCFSTDSNSVNVGVFGMGNDDYVRENQNSLVNIGVLGRTYCDSLMRGRRFNAGIFGQNIDCIDSIDVDSQYPIGSYAGYFDGDVLITGNIVQLSDRELKENIQPIKNTLEKLLNINIYSYYFKKDIGLSLQKKISYGILTDELEEEYPELVNNYITLNHKETNNLRDFNIYKSINYIGLIPLIIQAIKEQNRKIETAELSIKLNLEKEINYLKTKIQQMELANEYNLKSNLKSITNYNQTEVTIETNQLNCNNCWLIITDLTGKIIAQTQINKLENKASFSIEKVGNGVRLCNLVEDGKITNSIKFALFR